MRTPPLILIVDDNPVNVDIIQARLAANNYDTIAAENGEKGLEMVRAQHPDLILLDIMMPKMDGIELCKTIRADSNLAFMPIIMVTAKAGSKDVVAGIEAGADEYITKPVDQAALVARVKSMLRIKELHDTVHAQAARLKEQSTELEELNKTLEKRVEKQLVDLERVGRLKRFLSPQLAKLIVSQDNEKMLESHRQEITVVFCDLRGFTAFSETGEPEEVMGVLREYHKAMGELIFHFEGTLERFAGDGMMVFFNDPVPCPDPTTKAIRMAIDMRTKVGELSGKWRKSGHSLHFGIGISQGFATLGKIGFEGRFDYAAIGTVTNLASRICDEARAGQILISQRAYSAVEDLLEVEPIGELPLKGLHRPVTVYNVIKLKN
jgi:class 3 adenylate cyclase/CheY-like chemotaxis protein